MANGDQFTSPSDAGFEVAILSLAVGSSKSGRQMAGDFLERNAKEAKREDQRIRKRNAIIGAVVIVCGLVVVLLS